MLNLFDDTVNVVTIEDIRADLRAVETALMSKIILEASNRANQDTGLGTKIEAYNLKLESIKAELESNDSNIQTQLSSWLTTVITMLTDLAAISGIDNGQLAIFLLQMMALTDQVANINTHIQTVEGTVPETTDDLEEGVNNKYVNSTNILGVLLAGIVEGVDTSITAADTIKVAFQNIQKQISVVKETLLTKAASATTLNGYGIVDGLGFNDKGIANGVAPLDGTGKVPMVNLPPVFSGGSGTGTVTSVSLTMPTGFAVTGSPIQDSGTFTVIYSNGYVGYTTAEANKLAGISAGAQVNVRADWNAVDTVAEILNKPTTLSGYGITNAYTKTEVDAKVASIYKIKPPVATFNALPTVDNVEGDARNVIDTGDNYVWVAATGWDKLSGVVDLSGYYTKVESDGLYAGAVHSHTKSDVGLGNVDNTSDVNKPVSTATQTALDAKVDKTIQVIAGNALTGGGALNSNVTLAVNSATTAQVGAIQIATDVEASDMTSINKAITPANLGAISSTTNSSNSLVKRDASGSFSAGTITASLSGNSSTATALQNARLINGTSFDGTSNITTSSWGTARLITIGGTSKSVDGSSAVTWSLVELGAQAVLTNSVSNTISGTEVQRAALTGDVTAVANSNSTTVANNAISNAKAADMPTMSIKGNNTGVTADPLDLTVAQVRTMLNVADGAEVNVNADWNAASGDGLINNKPANLVSIGGLTMAANQSIYSTGAGTFAVYTLSTNGRTLIGQSTTADMRTNLGLGTAAVVNTGASGATIPLLNGSNTWSATQTLLNTQFTTTVNNDTPTTAASFTLNRSRAGATAVASGDTLANMFFGGHNGTSYVNSALISVAATDNYVASTTAGSEIKFATVLTGASETTRTNRWGIDGTAALRPYIDNSVNLASSSFRIKDSYFVNAPTVTSDANQKTKVTLFVEAELNCAYAMANEIGWFKWLDAIEEKGNAARKHVGLTVQRAIEIMEEYGLAPFDYGFICYNEWEAEYNYPTKERTIVDDFGDEITFVEPTGEKVCVLEAGQRYSFRDGELWKFMMAGKHAHDKLLLERLTAIENQLNSQTN